MQQYIYAIWEKKTCFCFVDTRDYDLEQKIDLEIKMREGTQKLLAACKHSNQTLEAAKSLLTSNERMNAYMAELHRRRHTQYNGDKLKCNTEGSKAKVSISDIRVPLIWKDSDHFKNKGDYRRFAVFCLLKVGTEIYDTVMVSNVDRNTTDITFDDVCVFSNVTPDFEFKLEMYSRVLHDDLSIASTPRKLTKKLSTSVSKTLGRKLAAAVKDDLESENGPKFNLSATATLRIKDASDAIKTHDLVMENLEGRSQLPLFGHFCCRLAVEPECKVQEKMCGYVKVKEVTAKTQRIESIYWGSLKSFQLRLWSKKYDRNSNYGTASRCKYDKMVAELVIPINSKTKMNSGTNALTIHNEDKCFVLSVDHSFGDIKQWANSIEQMQTDFIAWEAVAEYNMEILSPSYSRAPMFLKARNPGSLYDETPIQVPTEKATINSYPLNGTIPRNLNNKNIDLRISTSDSLRSRSSSLSSSCTNSSSATSNGKHSSQSSPTQQFNNESSNCKHNFLFFRSPPSAAKAVPLY